MIKDDGKLISKLNLADFQSVAETLVKVIKISEGKMKKVLKIHNQKY
jgi:hypothetical protein